MRLPHELRTWPWLDRRGQLVWLKLIALLLLIVPAVWTVYNAFTGPWLFPVVHLVYWSGVWATILLLVTLAITPLRRIFRLNRVIGVRRMLGVGALVYSVAHTISYFWLRDFQPGFIVNETFTRLTLIVATVSLVGLFALGVTSLDDAIRKMGARKWDLLHKTTYVFTGLAVWHFLLSPGATGGLPYLMLGLFVWLMVWRWFNARRMGTDLRVLTGLAVASTAVVVLSEAIVPALRFEMDPVMSLSFNFSLILGIAPGWHMLAWSGGVALAALIYQRRGASSRAAPA